MFRFNAFFITKRVPIALVMYHVVLNRQQQQQQKIQQNTKTNAIKFRFAAHKEYTPKRKHPQT